MVLGLQCVAQIALRQDIVRLEPDRHLVLFDRLLVPAPHSQHIGEIVMGFGHSRKQADRALVVNDRRIQIVELGVDIAQIVVRVGLAGIDGQGPLIAADRLFVALRGMEAAAEIDVGVHQAGIARKRLGILNDGVIMTTEMPIGVAEADVDHRRFRRDGEGGLVMRQGRLEPAEALQGEAEILVGFAILRIDRKRLFVLNDGVGEVTAGAQHIGQVKARSGLRRVERNGRFEVMAGAVEIVDPDKGGSEHRLVVDRLARHIDRFSDQLARFIERSELAAHRRQSAQGAEMVRLAGKKLPIGLFGGMQGIAARDRCCSFNARPAGESGFIHERDYLIGCVERIG